MDGVEYTIDRGTEVFELKGADYMVRLVSKEVVRDVGTARLLVSWEDSVGVVLRDSTRVVAVASVDSLFVQIESGLAWDERAMQAGIMRVSAENERVRLTVYFTRLGGVTSGGKSTVEYVNADCFVALK